MRDRLIEMLTFVRCKADCCGAFDGDRCGDLDRLDRCQIEAIADEILEDGWVRLPCKVGDTVYVLFGEPSQTIKEFRVRTIVFAEIHDSIGFTNKSMFTIWDKRWYDFFGKTIFTTREEAEQALTGGLTNVQRDD